MKETSLFRTIIDNVEDGVFFTDGERRISLWNTAATVLTGYTAKEAVGRLCHQDFLCHASADGTLLCEDACPLTAVVADGQPRTQEMLLRHKLGYPVPVTVKTLPVYSGGQLGGTVQIFSLQQKQLQAPHPGDSSWSDTLCGLPNRRYLEGYIRYKLQGSLLLGTHFAVVFADIDDFVLLNSQYGTVTGEEILCSIADNFRANLRAGDMLGKWSTQEFVGVLEVRGPAQLMPVAERVRMLIARSGIVHKGAYLAATASVGVALARPDDTVQSLLQRAEDCMQKSKQRGKNCSTADIQEI